jgi:hypothetical protein
VSEVLIREVLVFGGAVAGAVWGYYLGKIIERRRVAAEVSGSLETVERWAIDVCRGLEDLERSLARMGHFTVSDAPEDHLVDAPAALHDARRMSSRELADEVALKRFLSRVTHRA